MGCDTCSRLGNLCKRHRDDGDEEAAEKAKAALQAHQKRAAKVTAEISIIRQNAEFGFINSKLYKNATVTPEILKELSSKRPVHKCNVEMKFRIQDLEQAKLKDLKKECKAHDQSCRRDKSSMVAKLRHHYHYDHLVPLPEPSLQLSMPPLESDDIKVESDV